MDKLEEFVRLLFLVCAVGYFPLCMYGFLMFRGPSHIVPLWALVISVIVNGIYDLVKYVLSKFRERSKGGDVPNG